MNAMLVALALLTQFDMGGRPSSADLMMAGHARNRAADLMMAGEAVVEDKLPEVFAYSMAGCVPCVLARLEIAAANDLPFRVVWQDVAAPGWLEGRPGFWWHTSKDQPSQQDIHNTRQFVGWSGIKDFQERWKKSREPKRGDVEAIEAAAAPTPGVEVERVIGLLPKPNVAFVDFGCGDGRWLIAAVERWNCRAVGVELDPARAAATRERVRNLGMSDRITIITGDATTTDVEADVGVAYLYSPVLDQLRPRIEKLRAFASYLHQPPGLPVVRNGDSWLYVRGSRAVQQSHSAAVWQGQYYSQPVCNSPNCAMCRAIRQQLNMPNPPKGSVWWSLF